MLYDFIFHFNPYTKKWEAATRENYHQIFNGGPDVIRSSSIDTLVELINKTGGSRDKIEELLEVPTMSLDEHQLLCNIIRGYRSTKNLVE